MSHGADYATILLEVIAAIRAGIDEDWIHDFAIDADTRLGEDLEIESIEMVVIAGALCERYGERINLLDWLSSLQMGQLIELTPGDLARHIASMLQEARL
jgi:acyl carrier protein